MADNTLYTPGSGATIAADDIGSGVLAQRVKPVWGVDGVGNDVSAAFGLPISQGFTEFTGTAAALNADIVPSTDVRGYQQVSIQISGTYSGTLSYQGSNDNTNWFSLSLFIPGTFYTGAVVTNSISSAVGIFVGVVQTRYIRIRATAYASGTATGTVELSTAPFSNPVTEAQIQGFSQSVVVIASGSPNETTGTSELQTVQKLYSPSSSFPYVRARTPEKFHSASVSTTGNSALWTPTSGKKFRLQRFQVIVTSNAATSGGAVITIGLQDATTDIGVSQAAFVPSTAVTTGGVQILHSGWIDLGNGFLSAAANNVLNINLSAALTSGVVNVVAVGTEE